MRQLLDEVILSCPNKKFHGEASGICEAVLKFAEMKVHLETKCPFRIVECRHKDCFYHDFARTISLHEASCLKAERKEPEFNFPIGKAFSEDHQN